MTTVRPAAPEDASALLALTEEMDRFYGATAGEPAALRRGQLQAALFAATPSAYALVACDPADSVVGFATYSFLWPAVGLTRSLYLKELYVAGGSQRAGVGTLLMRAVIDVANETNCSRVEWTTDRDNHSAQNFYASLGLESLQTKVFYRLKI